MTAGEIIAELSKVPSDQEIYVQDNGTGEHLKVERLTLSDDEGCWPDGHSSKQKYPVFNVEE